MATANNNGWDFVKAGETYQYKEDWFIGDVKILEDNSDDEQYKFTVEVVETTDPDCFPIGREFEVSHAKDFNGYWSGMINFYKNPEYITDYNREMILEAAKKV